MKNTKKALLALTCAVMLVVGSVMGTMAYLQDTDEVVNTFTVGNVQLTLDEFDVDNSTVGENDRDQANAYKLMPGHEYAKDPIVHVTKGSEESYVFVTVKNEIAKIEVAATKGTVEAQMLANGWTKLDNVTKDGVQVWAYNKTVTPATDKDTDLVVFEQFKVDGNVDNETLATYTGKTIVVTAYAIQADGMNGAADAWTKGGF